MQGVQSLPVPVLLCRRWSELQRKSLPRCASVTGEAGKSLELARVLIGGDEDLHAEIP